MARPHVEILRSATVPPGPLPAAGWPAGAEARVLSRDPETGAFSALLSLPAGWRRPACSHPAAALDLHLVAGALQIGGRPRSAGFYGHWPAGALQGEWVVGRGGATAFLGARSAAPDIAAAPAVDPAAAGAGREAGAAVGVVEFDTERLEWEVAPEGPPDEQISGLPPGIVTKTLRWVEQTGELMALCATVPRWDYPRLEFHECVEEAFMVRGDIWLGSSGTMREGDYFWRPPFVTHGPFWSQAGSLFLVYTDSLLVDHVAEGPTSTPLENRLLLERQRTTA